MRKKPPLYIWGICLLTIWFGYILGSILPIAEMSEGALLVIAMGFIAYSALINFLDSLD